MKLNCNLRLAVIAALSVAVMTMTSARTIAQDSRPRYSSAQSGDRGWTVPSDTVISVQMNATLSSRTARVGDKFTATVTVPVYVNGRTVIPAGSIVEGRVTQVTPAKRMNRSGTIGIDFDALVFPDGSAVNLIGSLTSDDPETRRRIDDESRVSGGSNKQPSVFIGGGGAIGAVLGGIAGGGKGAVLGGIAGAGAGVATVLLSKGEEAQVPSGTPFGIQIKQALVLRESATSETSPDPSDRSSDQPAYRPSSDRSSDQPAYRPSSDRSSDQPAYRPSSDRSSDQPAYRPSSDRSSDQPTYRPSGDRQDRSEPVRAQPDIPDRPVSAGAETDTRSDVDRSGAAAPALPLSSPEMLRRAQGALREQGYYEGDMDGVMSSRTSGALRVYQKEHNLQETGDLDPPTARSLGIVGPSTANDRTGDRRREASAETSVSPEAVMANVLSASANRMQDGAISIIISTQANTGGWRWVGEHVVNGDTLEVYARAIRPTGMVTQALTRGRIELTVKDGVQYVRRVVIHSASGDQMITLGGRTGAGAEPSAPSSGTPSGTMTSSPASSAASSATSLHRKAEELLSEYQRLYGVRMTGTGVEVDNAAQYREAEIELLFAIDSFVNSTQLYERFATSFRDRESMRGATLAMARQARRTDRVISTLSTRSADALATRWDSLRQDVLRLMQTYNIGSSEIEN